MHLEKLKAEIKQVKDKNAEKLKENRAMINEVEDK